MNCRTIAVTRNKIPKHRSQAVSFPRLISDVEGLRGLEALHAAQFSQGGNYGREQLDRISNVSLDLAYCPRSQASEE